MPKRYTEAHIRIELKNRLQTMTQKDIARVVDMHQPDVSVAVRGGAIPAKLSAWLGFRKVEGIYERRAK